MNISCLRHSVLVPIALACSSMVACTTVPPIGNRPPVISEVTSVQFGQNNSKSGWNVTAVASDPDNDPITIEFDTNQFGVQHVDNGSGMATVEILNEIEDAWMTVRATDGRGGEATNRFDIRQDNRSPIISLHTADRFMLLPTDQTTIRAIATDIDQDSLDITTTLTQGANLATLSSPSQSPGFYSVELGTSSAPSGTVRAQTLAEDNKGGEASSAFDLQVGVQLALDTPWETPGLSPYAMDFDSEGNLYVSSIANDVIVFRPDGTRDTAKDIPLPSTISIRALLVDESGPTPRIIIGQENGAFAGRMLVFNLQNTQLPDLFIDNSTIPHYILDRPDGTLLISDNKGDIKHYDPATETIIAPSPWGSSGSGPGQYIQPRQISHNPNDGSLFIADKGNNRIKHISASGATIRNWGSVPLPLDIPHGVAYDPRTNTVVVADTDNDRLIVFTTEGVELQIVTLPSGASPRYILAGSDGRFYIASYSHQQIYTARFQ